MMGCEGGWWCWLVVLVLGGGVGWCWVVFPVCLLCICSPECWRPPGAAMC